MLLCSSCAHATLIRRCTTYRSGRPILPQAVAFLLMVSQVYAVLSRFTQRAIDCVVLPVYDPANVSFSRADFHLLSLIRLPYITWLFDPLHS